MVENTVQHDADIVCVKILADIPEVLVGAKTTVNGFEITSIVSVIVGIEDWI